MQEIDIDLLKKEFEETEDKQKKVEIGANLSRTLCNLGSTAEALEYGFKTVDLTKEIGDDIKYIAVMLTIAETYYQMIENEKCVEYGNVALAKAIEIDNSFQIAMSHYTLSLIEQNPKNAIEHALKTKEICEMNGNTDMLGAACYSLGRQYHNIKKIDLSIDSYIKALNLAKHPSQKGILYMSIGEIYIEIQDFEQAYDYITGAFRMFKKINCVPGLLSCFNYLGFIYIEKKKYNKAKESANSALKLSDENNVDTCEYSSDSFNILAKVAHLEKDYEKAKEYFDFLLNIEDELPTYKSTKKVFYDNYIEYLKEIGDTAECEKYEKKLRELFEG